MQYRFKDQILKGIIAIVFVSLLSQTSYINTQYCSFERVIMFSQNGSHQVFHQGAVDSISIIEYSTIDEALEAINAGSADIFGHMINASDYQKLENYPNIKLQWAYDTKLCMIAINTLSYPLENKLLRQAIAYAVNKTTIAEEAMNGTVDIADFLLPLNNEFSIELEEGGEFYNANPTEATKKLGKIGLIDVDDDGVVESSNGSEFILEIIYPYDIAGLQETAVILSTNLITIGLNNTLIPMSYDDIQYEIASHNQTYDLALYHENIPEFGLGEMATTFDVGNLDEYGKNIANIDNEILNDLANQYRDNIYLDRVDEYGVAAVRAIREICPVVPLFFYRWLSVYSEQRFTGWLDETSGGAYSVWNPISVTARSTSQDELIIAVLPKFFDSFFKSLNPFYSGVNLDHNWLVKNQFNPYMLIYDSPLATLPNGKAVPRSATSWTMHYLIQDQELNSTESRSQFYCDSNAIWADNEKMDAQDYRFTYEYYAEYNLTNFTTHFVDVKVTGDYVSAITLNNRGMFNYRKLGMLPILPKHIWENRNPMTWNPDVQYSIGSGPYKVSEFNPGDELLLTRNALYYPEVDSDPPTLRNLIIMPENPVPAESVSFRVYIDDRSKIENVTLSYVYMVGRINFTESQLMREGAAGYEATIPSKVTANKIAYNITARDIWGNTAILASGSYERRTTETDLEWWQDSTILLLIGTVSIVVIIIGFFLKRRK